MTQNQTRRMTPCPYFSYSDAPTAIDWLQRAFGFETTMRYDDDQGHVMHAELRRDGVVIIVFSDEDGRDRAGRKGETVGHGVYVSVPDVDTVDALHAAALAAGGTSVWEPAWSDWNYRCRVDDPEGYEWSLGIHVPGERATEDWTSEEWAG